MRRIYALVVGIGFVCVSVFLTTPPTTTDCVITVNDDGTITIDDSDVPLDCLIPIILGPRVTAASDS